MKRLLLVTLILLVPCISFAQEKTFPTGVPVGTQALFCLDKDSAQVIADNRGEESPEIEVLLITGKCRQMRGVAIYVREVYRKDGWAVWELTSRNIPTFYEATDWKPKKKGTDV